MTDSNDCPVSDATKAGKKSKPRAYNLGKPFDISAVPAELASLRHWLPYQDKVAVRFFRGGTRNGFSNQDATHTSSLLTLPDLLAEMDRRGWLAAKSHGVMFAPMQDTDSKRWWVCLDWDKLNPDDPASWPAMLQEARSANAGWACLSDGGKGVRIVGFIRFDSTNGDRPKNDDGRSVGAGELKFNTSCTCTSQTLWSGSLDITDLVAALQAKIAAAEPPKPAKAAKPKRSAAPVVDDTDPELMARIVAGCESYVAKAEPAVSGANGHTAFMRVCGIIASGFGLCGPEGEAIARDWNRNRCGPPFSEAEFQHKWDDATSEAAGDARGPTLRDGIVRNYQRTLKRREKQASGAEVFREISAEIAEENGEAARADDAGPAPGTDAPAREPESAEAETATEPEAGPATRERANREESSESGGESILTRMAKDGRWIVVTNGDNLDKTRESVCMVLAKSDADRVYQRGGVAVVIRDRDAPITLTCPKTGKEIVRGSIAKPCITTAEHGHMLSAISRQITFRRVKKDPETGKQYLEPVGMPGAVSVMVRQCPNELPPLRGLLYGPSYDSEFDRVLSEPGYHPSIGFHNVSDLSVQVPDRVTQEDAAKAAEAFLAPFRFFPWPESDGGPCLQRIRLLTAALTALLRWSFGPAPAISLSGRAAGSGKSEVFKALSIICHGCQPRIMNWVTGRDADLEIRKRIVMLLASGESFVLMDNLPNGLVYESPTLDAVLTSASFYDRTLGSNSAGSDTGGPNRLAIFMTGNAIQPCSDLGERVLRIEFTAPPDGPRRLVNPDKFGDEDGHIGLLLKYVEEHREELLTALLTICRGYQQAGRPILFDSHWGSFPDWKRECVDPIAWATGRDPLEGLAEEMQEAAELADGLPALIAAWHDEFGRERLSSRELKTICTPDSPLNQNRPAWLNYRPEFAEALSSATRTDNVADLSTVALGRRLQVFAGRPKDGPRPAIDGKGVVLSDGNAWMLMTVRDKARNQQLFWVQQLRQTSDVKIGNFTGGRRLPDVVTMQQSNRGVGQYSDSGLTPSVEPTNPPNRVGSGTNLRQPPDLRNTQINIPATQTNTTGLSKPGDLAQRWLPELARFAVGPVTRGDLREWFDTNGIHETVRVVLSRHLKTVALGQGTGVQFDPDAAVRADGAGSGRA